METRTLSATPEGTGGHARMGRRRHERNRGGLGRYWFAITGRAASCASERRGRSRPSAT